MKPRHLAHTHRPRQDMLQGGSSAYSVAPLICLIEGPGAPHMSVRLSKLWDRHGSLCCSLRS